MKRILILLRRKGKLRSYILKSVLELKITVCSHKQSTIKNTFYRTIGNILFQNKNN